MMVKEKKNILSTPADFHEIQKKMFELYKTSLMYIKNYDRSLEDKALR